ncbi:PQQ-dependent sugar dehydrogenase [Streptomyces johnsoniae]|uniref:PQQ-dependent sugar dehydrogenase n=1 Tax=Streptomyces johnsoniae TaxID=3075532 RepID=A0ABU2RZC6_9ACTN|nr:PQQ-dependent sugar dehydrogenase [Streptomyces sp. DSM 41886]MDT0441170.1 PQQ-dependent sugar dehydrogenase [Streptomyces sp. DSM 41886]
MTVRGVRRGGPAALLALAVLAAGCSSDGGDEEGDGGREESASASEPAPSDSAEETEETAEASPSAAPAQGEAEVVETVAEGLDSPWGIVSLPDGDLLVGSRDGGRVDVVDADSGDTEEAGTVPGVAGGQGEGGLLGLALEPDFEPGGRLFAYYTAESDNRISVFRYDASAPAGERLTPDGELLTGIPRGEVIHNGGGLAFGPDGMLYASTGDIGDGDLAQDAESLAGKILRIDPETGEPPEDNPDPGSLVYSMGHRNVQGLAWDGTEQLWAAEFGNDAWDELNRIEPGANYGWPEYEGRGGEDAGFVDPVEQWPPAEASPSDLAFSQGSLWLAALRGERLWRVPLDGSEPAAEPQSFFEGEYGRLRALLATGGDELLLVTNETDSRGSPDGDDDRILRLRVR